MSNTISPSVGTFSIKSNKSFVILSLSDTKNPLAPLLVILLSFIPGNSLIISSLHSLGTKYLTSTSLGLVVSISIVKAWPLSLIIINTLFFNETISVIPQSISNGNSLNIFSATSFSSPYNVMGSSIVFLFVPICGMDSNISSLFTILECIECNNSFTVFAFFTNPGNFDGFEKNAYPTKPSFTSSIKFSLILANSELYIF